jgi:nicotinamide-nucleotide amidase
MVLMSKLAEDVLIAAKNSGQMIATAESCTGGMIAAALTEIPGSSSVVDRGFVTYSYPSKTALLDVPAEMLAEHGAVSEPVARAMAAGALAHSDAQLAVAVTGVAGPGASDEKPEGRVHFAIANGDTTHHVVKDFGPLGRAQVRAATVKTALRLLLDALT